MNPEVFREKKKIKTFEFGLELHVFFSQKKKVVQGS